MENGLEHAGGMSHRLSFGPKDEDVIQQILRESKLEDKTLLEKDLRDAIAAYHKQRNNLTGQERPQQKEEK